MKKRIITFIAVIVIFIAACAVIVKLNNKDKELTKIKGADTTLTSRIYMT